MVFIFWQGIISIHQKAFLEALALQPSVTKVLLVVEEEITPYRKNMGWEAPAIEHVEIRKSPSKKEIKGLVWEYRDAVHVMGGVRVGSMIALALDECIKHKCRLGIMTEPYNHAGMKGWLRTIKYRYYRNRYFRHIRFVLAIGKMGVQQYKALRYDEQYIFPWAYFVSLEQGVKKAQGDQEIKKIIFAGRLEEGKGICRFVEELMQSRNSNYRLDLYGTGPDEDKLKRLVSANKIEGKINFHPFLKHEDLLKKYADYDWVVLPSTQKDGWGVIISEGLLNGLKAICSSICGVSWVIKDGWNGVVFDWAQEGSCRRALDRLLHDDTFAEPALISAWANKTISGKAGAEYFLKIMDCVYLKKEKPGIPWGLNPAGSEGERWGEVRA